MKIVDLTGQRLGRLTVIRKLASKEKRSVWECKCDCGVIKELNYTNICPKAKHPTRSCGCYLKEMRSKGLIHKTHGFSRTKFYKAYSHAKARCTCQTDKRFSLYGGRGIKFLWESFEDFKKDMFLSFEKHVLKHGSKNTTLDRIDVDGPYSSVNCRWATWKEQQSNRRNTGNCKYKDFQGTKEEVWLKFRRKDLPFEIFRSRLEHGWTIERALTQLYKK